jgi:RHS repeat-associated protein
MGKSLTPREEKWVRNLCHPTTILVEKWLVIVQYLLLIVVLLSLYLGFIRGDDARFLDAIRYGIYALIIKGIVELQAIIRKLAGKKWKTYWLILYTYDPEHQLTRIDFPDATWATYAYDALGRRIQKNVNGAKTRYVYDNEDILLEYDGTNTLQARHTHGPGIDEPWLLERDLNSSGSFESNEVFTYHADALGSIVRMTGALGNEARSYRYDSFGQLTAETGTLRNPYTYTGRERDQESGLSYYRARYYDPAVGRFLRGDPLSLATVQLPSAMSQIAQPFLSLEQLLLLDPLRQHHYTYVENNPVLYTDPTGEVSAATLTWVVLALLAAPYVVRLAVNVYTSFLVRAPLGVIRRELPSVRSFFREHNRELREVGRELRGNSCASPWRCNGLAVNRSCGP